MRPAEILSSVVSGVAVLLLAAIWRVLYRSTRDFRRFMAEHSWLLATTLWTRDKVLLMMTEMGMPVDHPPPDDLPRPPLSRL